MKPIKGKIKIGHVNPNCLGAEYCEPHGADGEVYYSSKNVIKFAKEYGKSVWQFLELFEEEIRTAKKEEYDRP